LFRLRRPFCLGRLFRLVDGTGRGCRHCFGVLRSVVFRRVVCPVRSPGGCSSGGRVVGVRLVVLDIGDARDVHRRLQHLVEAHLVVRALEGLVAGDQLLAGADERGAHRATTVVDDVVIAGENVLGELDVARELRVRERLVGLRERRFVRVVLRLRLAAPLLH